MSLMISGRIIFFVNVLPSDCCASLHHGADSRWLCFCEQLMSSLFSVPVCAPLDERWIFLTLSVGGLPPQSAGVSVAWSVPTSFFGPQIRRGYPPNLSISFSGGKETKEDSPSNGERTGTSPAPNLPSSRRQEMWCVGGPTFWQSRDTQVRWNAAPSRRG